MACTVCESGIRQSTDCERQAASHQVGGVPELLEMILLQLPLPDILFAQSVNHTWKRTIEGSPRLQKALFFRSTEDTVVVIRDNQHRVRDCKDSAQCMPNESGARTPSEGVTASMVHREIAINPFLLSRFPRLVLGSPQSRDRRNSSFQLQSASWRKMLASQPAIASVVVHDEGPKHFHQVRACDRTQGLTINDIQSHADAFPGEMYSLWPESKGGWMIYNASNGERRLQYSAEEILDMISYCASGGGIMKWEWKRENSVRDASPT